MTTKGKPGEDREPGQGEEFLGDILVHLDGRTQDARAHIGDFREFKEPLQGSVLSACTVNNGKEHIQPQLFSGVSFRNGIWG